MTNSEKAFIYDECVREADELYRKINRIKGEYVVNIPEEKMMDIRLMEDRIRFLENKLNGLFLD